MASQPQDIGKQSTRYHWWYDNKAAGVRNPPGIGMHNNTPPSSPPGNDNAPRRFSLTSGLTNMTGTSPPAGADIVARPRRDSLKNMFHLSDFGTPGT
jgi:hypothetical protein